MPWLGRWGSADPKATHDGQNFFRYASNNPVSFGDRQGTQSSILAGPDELRDPNRRADAASWFLARGYEIHHWDAEARLWRVLPRIDGSIGGLTMQGTGSTGGATPVPAGSSRDRPPAGGYDGDPIPGLDDLDEPGNDPLSGILEDTDTDGAEHTRRGLSREGSSEGSRFGREGGSSEGSLLTGADGGTEQTTALDEAAALVGIAQLDFIGTDPNDPNAAQSGVPSGALGLLDFGATINKSLYIGSAVGSVLLGALGAAFSRLRSAVRAIRPSAVFRPFSTLSTVELAAIRRYFSRLNEATGNHRLAGSAFHEAMGARRVGTDLLSGGSAVELKTAMRRTDDIEKVIEEASAQSLRDSMQHSRLEGLVTIRIVRIYDMARKVLIVTH